MEFLYHFLYKKGLSAGIEDIRALTPARKKRIAPGSQSRTRSNPLNVLNAKA